MTVPVKAVPRVAPAPIVANWSGLYIGGHVGWGRARDSGIWDPSERPPIDFGNLSLNGLVLGMHAGYNWQLGPAPWGSWLVGIEGDASGTPGWHDWKHHIGAACSFGNICSTFYEGKVDWLASIRGRLGLVFDRTLLYATGGVAFARASAFAGSSSAQDNAFLRFSSVGGVVGGGIEWKYNPSLSLRLEGLHYIFNDTKTFDGSSSSGPRGVPVKFDNVSVIRVGASWMFGPGDLLPFGIGKGKGPVVARY
jgi:outer membrane immunogenic protein